MVDWMFKEDSTGAGEVESHRENWRKHILGRGNSKRKGLEAGSYLKKVRGAAKRPSWRQQF